MDAKGLSRIFCVLSDNVTLRNLNLINGFHSEPSNEPSFEDFNITPVNVDWSVNNDSSIIESFNKTNNDSVINGSNGDNIDPIYKNKTLLNGSGAAIKWMGDDGCLKDVFCYHNFFESRLGLFNPILGAKVISWIGANGTIKDSFFVDNNFHVLSDMLGTHFDSPIIDKKIFWRLQSYS